MRKSVPFTLLMAGRHSALLALAILLFLASPSSGRGLHDNVLGLRLGMIRKPYIVAWKRSRPSKGKKEVARKFGRWRETLASPHCWVDSIQISKCAMSRPLLARAVGECATANWPNQARPRGKRQRRLYAIHVGSQAGRKSAGYFLIAEGRDPEYLRSFSIKRHN